MDDDAGDIRQKAAALGADAIEGQQRRGGDMQPSRRAADPKAGLVHVLDRRRGDVVSHDIGEVSEAPGTVPADPGDGRGRQLHAEEIGQQLDQTLLGQQLVVQEIEHERADPRAVLHRRVDAVRKQRTRLRAASSAPAIVRTMLGDDERPRLGQIEHLPGAVADARVRIQARAAPGAGRRVMIDHDVGIGDLPQRFAFVALLPARFLAGPVPQARHPRRLLQPITRRRLAAVRTVQPEPALELPQPRLQRRILGLQGRDQREKVVHRCARGGDSRVIRCLNRNPSPPSREFFRRTPLSPNLGSYSFRHHRLCVVALHPAAPRLHDAAVRIGRVCYLVGIHARIGFLRLASALAPPGRLLLHVPRRDLLLLASGRRRGAVRQLLPARRQPGQAVAAALQVRGQRTAATRGPELAVLPRVGRFRFRQHPANLLFDAAGGAVGIERRIGLYLRSVQRH